MDRSGKIQFTFNGKSYQGLKGDTLASALLANGERLTARSFKYHRPRGIMAAGIEEPGTYVELLGSRACANMPATIVELQPGLRAKSVNCWPSPGTDFAALLQFFAPVLPAAFYYKTFIWPGWRLYEPAIRRVAGLANAPSGSPGEGSFEARNWNCDVLVAGAGPSGLAAALVAGRAGARVLLADQDTEAGGHLLWHDREINGRPAMEWVGKAVSELADMPNVIHLQNALVWAIREHNLLLVREQLSDESRIRERNWRVRAGRVILATGATERTLVFQNNDRPGIMLASAVQAYIHRYAVRPGKRAVLFSNNGSIYAVAAAMRAAGIEVAAIIDARATVPGFDREMAGAEVLAQHEVITVRGSRKVREVLAEPIGGGKVRRFACDLVVVSGGWNPSVQLWSQSRGKLRYCEELAAFLPYKGTDRAISVGGAAGKFRLGQALESGERAGKRVLKGSDRIETPSVRETSQEPHYDITPFWHSRAAAKNGFAFVDIMNDVTVGDVHLAIREGYDNIEHVKRFTTAGMGPDQGRTGNVNVIGAVSLKKNLSMDEVGVTTYRPATAPVSFGAIAGTREGSVVLPYRHTPITQWNIDRGAVMYEAGARWRRPGYFPKAGESLQEAVNREAKAVRDGVGVYDASPLGTFEIKGPDAGKFLDYIYTNDFSDLPVGMGKYGLMLTDDGLILDDGVSFRLGRNRFQMSTSTGGADTVYRHMEKTLAVDRPNWSVMITDLTCQWMNATICGPHARELLHAIETDIDISREAFPFMAIRDGRVAGMRARVARVSFTGELSFEVNVRARDMLSLWETIMAAGASFGIEPVGSETSHALRVEKGFLSLAHEVDGTTDPFDLGMGWIMSRKKADFLGKRSVMIRRGAKGPRRELVGLLTRDGKRLVEEGAPITRMGRKECTEGLVTASVWSVANSRSVALALLKGGRSRMGESAYIRLPGEIIEAEIVAPCFYDPKGLRLRG